MKNYFTSDTHLQHGNIIRYCSRPFASVDEMDAALINNWNAVVSPEDTVWHLGDIIFTRDFNKAKRMIERLNGKINFIMGNHDNIDIVKACKNVDRIYSGYAEVINSEGQRIVMCHFPFEEWNGMYQGSWHLHGHIHNSDKNSYHTVQKLPNRIDVGVDNHPNYAPFSFEEVKRAINA